MLQQLLGRSEEGMSAVWKIDGGLAREVLTEDLLGSLSSGLVRLVTWP